LQHGSGHQQFHALKINLPFQLALRCQILTRIFYKTNLHSNTIFTSSKFSHHQALVHNSSAKQHASNQHEADDTPSPKPALRPRTASCCLLHCTWARMSKCCSPELQPLCWPMYTSWQNATKSAVQGLDVHPHNRLDM
jgi:hypothetical protein